MSILNWLQSEDGGSDGSRQVISGESSRGYSQVRMREYNIHRLFEASVTLKGFHALLELATGVATLAVGPVRVSNFFYALAQREWLGGAHIWLVNFLVRLADASLRGGEKFVGIYLLVVGTINMVLVIGLLVSALWAYPAALTAIALLMTYQLYRYAHSHVLALLLLTVYDAVVWWLVHHEYRTLQGARAAEQVRFSNSS